MSLLIPDAHSFLVAVPFLSAYKLYPPLSSSLPSLLPHSAAPSPTSAMADLPGTGAPQTPLGTEGNPTHVVSRPAPTIGWAGVQSGVEEFDREEIQGYKEDMDALLVFVSLLVLVWHPCSR